MNVALSGWFTDILLMLSIDFLQGVQAKWRKVNLTLNDVHVQCEMIVLLSSDKANITKNIAITVYYHGRVGVEKEQVGVRRRT